LTARRFVRNTVCVNAVLAAVAGAVSLAVAGKGPGFAALAGGLAGSLNVLVIGLIAMRMFSPGAGRASTVALLLVKMGVLAGLALLAVGILSVSPVGLAIGVSTTVVAVLSMSCFVALRGDGVTL
jgi:hypothetical protein